MKGKPKPSFLFLYAVIVSAMAFVFGSSRSLLLPASLNTLLGFSLGRKSLPMKLVLAILLLNGWGAALNGIYFHNTGYVILSFGAVTIKSGAFQSFAVLNLRFLLIIGSTLFMLGMSGGSRELVKSLERDLRMPSWMAFSISHSFRLFPLISRDYGELMIARKERGIGSNVMNPAVLKEVLFSIMNVGYERAIWSGISAELRGVRLRKAGRREPLSTYDVALLVLAAAEWVSAAYLL